MKKSKKKIKLEFDGLKAIGFFVVAFVFIVGTVWFSSWLINQC